MRKWSWSLKLSFYCAVLWAPLVWGAPFRYHLLNEPTSLKPWEQKSSAAGYFLSQITGTLLTYRNGELHPNLAKSCRYQAPRQLVCELRADLKWSDGSTLTTADFVRAYQQFLSPQHPAFRADLLFPLKNARKVFAGEVPVESLGVRARKNQLVFELENSDSEFVYSLTSPLLAPLPASTLPSVDEIKKNPKLWLSSGAYEIEKWEPNQRILLRPQPHFWKKSAGRPLIEALFIPEDSVALNLYEKKELSFLRRLPTLFIPKYKGRSDYFEIGQYRFDYIGFSPAWQENENLRQALAQSLSFADLQNLFSAHGLPGCPGLNKTLYEGKICEEFNVTAAQKLWAGLKDKPAKLVLAYSKQGGDDHQRAMEWVQAEWKKNLSLAVEVRALENKIFVSELDKNPWDLFRKGVAPERPTCLAALETFETGNIENYLRLSDKKYDALLRQMRQTQNLKKKRQLCSQGLHILLDSARLIPTGPIHFTVLASPEWQGWDLNELNQLDLTDLRQR